MDNYEHRLRESQRPKPGNHDLQTAVRRTLPIWWPFAGWGAGGSWDLSTSGESMVLSRPSSYNEPWDLPVQESSRWFVPAK